MTDNANPQSECTCAIGASTRSYTPNVAASPFPKELPPTDETQSDYAWYPMYVKYRREIRVKEALDAQAFETFIPMEYKQMRCNGVDKTVAFPAIHNLIFVHSNRSRISWMKMFNDECRNLQYMSYFSQTENVMTVITVPDRQMENIIKAASVTDTTGLRSYIDTPHSALARVGKEIEFVNGPFAGVQGVIKRIDKNRVMLIHLFNDKSIKIRISSSQDVIYL